MNANLQAKVRSQTPTPGSEAVLRHLLAGLISVNPDFSAMSPELARATREQLPMLQASLAALGAIHSVEFRGVGNAGWYAYEIKHEHGTSHAWIELSTTGMLTGALFSPDP